MKMRLAQLLPWLGLWLFILVPRILNLQNGVPGEPIGEMERTAACFVNNGYFGDPYRPDVTTGPSAHIAPGYAAFLALIYTQFGTGTTGHNVQAVCSIFIMGIAISLLVPLGKKLFHSAWVGWMAAIAMSLLPLSINFLQVLGQWDQHISLLIAHLYLLLMLELHESQWQSWQKTLLFGIFTGGIILVNPQFALVAALFGILEIAIQRHRRNTIVKLAIAAILAILMITPWTLRNHRELGAWYFIRSNAGLEMWLGNRDEANGFSHFTSDDDIHSPFRQLHPLYSDVTFAKYVTFGEKKFMHDRRAEAEEWIRTHPERFAELCLIRARLFWFPPPRMWSANKAGRFTPELRSIMYCTINTFAIFGWLLLFRQAWRKAFIVATCLIGLSLAYYMLHVEIRYLFPLHGICVLLACSVVFSIAARLMPRRSSPDRVTT